MCSVHEQDRRNGEAQGLGGSHIDDLFEPRGLLDRDVAWLGTLQDFVHMVRRLTVTPVRLPPGRAKLAASRIATGSPENMNTTGIVPAPSLAGSTDGTPEATITSTLRRTSCARTSGICAARSAKPSSTEYPCPSTRP